MVCDSYGKAPLILYIIGLARHGHDVVAHRMPDLAVNDQIDRFRAVETLRAHVAAYHYQGFV